MHLFVWGIHDLAFAWLMGVPALIEKSGSVIFQAPSKHMHLWSYE